MKIIKELPKSLWQSIFLHLTSVKKLTSKKDTLPVIISLTSIPSRFSTLHIVIKSLFNQTKLPAKIILWIHKSLKKQVPKSILKLESHLFEIRYSTLTSSHKKLIHTLELHPDSVIITCDDDLIYSNKLIENLYNEHLKHPNDIIANRAHQIKLNSSKNGYLPYKKWKHISKDNNTNTMCGIGAWGILYPPKALYKDVFKEKLFLKLTPKADDLWFKAMSTLNNTLTRQSTNLPGEPIPIIGTQKIALKKENVTQNKNDLQWESLSNYYNLINVLTKKNT